MSQSMPTLSVPAGVSSEDFTRLVEKGKRHGSLTPDEVMKVLERVELSHDLIDNIRGRLAAEGIRFDEVSDVEIPVVQESVARRDPASPPAREQLPEEPEEVPAPVAAEPVPEPAAAAGRDPVPPDDMSPSTREVDVRALFETNDEVPPSEPVPAHSYDLLGPDALDSEVLDDDAFFATLRDAVHDEAPLGPRGEDDLTPERNFFDQDAERGTFRDVFRRRR